MSVSEATVLWDTRCQVGESPIWSSAEQALYRVDIEGRAVHRVGDAGQHQQWHSMAPKILLFSKKVWDTLGADEQKQIRAAAKEPVGYMRKLWDEREAKSLATVKAGGAQIRARLCDVAAQPAAEVTRSK